MKAKRCRLVVSAIFLSDVSACFHDTKKYKFHSFCFKRVVVRFM
jgi:hypothetical protein